MLPCEVIDLEEVGLAVEYTDVEGDDSRVLSPDAGLHTEQLDKRSAA